MTKGGIAVASRVRIAATTSLMVSGVLLGGAGAALAFADPAAEDTSGPSASQPNDDSKGPASGAPKAPDHPRTQAPPEPTKTAQPTKTSAPGRPSETGEPTPTEPPETTTPAGCEDDDDCGPDWPWWPSWLPQPGAMPIADGGGGGAVEVPDGPTPPAAMRVAEHVGVAPSPPAAPVIAPPIAPPVIVAPPIAVPVITAPPADGGAAAAPLPQAPVTADAQPPAPPAESVDTAAGLASSYRLGYPEALRAAEIPQLVALAAPGVAGMLVLTGAGGLLGYRQAKAGHAVHPAAARFVN